MFKFGKRVEVAEEEIHKFLGANGPASVFEIHAGIEPNIQGGRILSKDIIGFIALRNCYENGTVLRLQSYPDLEDAVGVESSTIEGRFKQQMEHYKIRSENPPTLYYITDETRDALGILPIPEAGAGLDLSEQNENRGISGN